MSHPLPDILPLTPFLRETVWGGRRLERYGKKLPPEGPIGESFEISTLPGQSSVVAAGPLAGASLADLVEAHGADLVGTAVCARYGTDFPLLIKLIDAQDDLSIQVHPDDDYARAHELGRFGKTEAWVVLHSEGARLALGLQPGTDKASLQAALTDGRAQDAILYQDVADEDVVFLRAGTVHALCRGVMVYEVQQSSEITFRLYDYGRKGLDGAPRELHIDHGLAVTDFASAAPRPQAAAAPQPEGTSLIDVDEFSLRWHGAQTDQIRTGNAFAAITVVAGSARFGAFDLACGQSALIPAQRAVAVQRVDDDVRFLEARPGC